ncbi:AlpA family phage regulatory protein [Halomonas sp. M4R5S39]|uniref:helix-turn-helix transcriptional regulator n=1 Tax=Halomonas kalidii TaxID=3043293 RepID=UPI0024A7D747|nr:AlpA family phage regulatory protein [Halomonas kalidii]MDI5987030.1 AlpA family phage regulatory protein [Halomonas kalidii]
MTYLTVKQIASRLAVSVPTIWRWSRDHDSSFPRPIKLGPNCTRWRLADLEEWENREEVAQ